MARVLAALYDIFRPDSAGRPLWPKELTGIEEKFLICPKCKAKYVYSPVTPRGERIPCQLGTWRFVLWCPEPCHRGRRVFMLAHTQSWVAEDSEVDWANQRLLYKPWTPPATTRKSED